MTQRQENFGILGLKGAVLGIFLSTCSHVVLVWFVVAVLLSLVVFWLLFVLYFWFDCFPSSYWSHIVTRCGRVLLLLKLLLLAFCCCIRVFVFCAVNAVLLLFTFWGIYFSITKYS